jgi:hypothetical protein
MSETSYRHQTIPQTATIQTRTHRLSASSTTPSSPQSKRESSPTRKTDEVALSPGLASAIEQLKNEIILEKKALLTLKQELAAKQEELEKARYFVSLPLCHFSISFI